MELLTCTKVCSIKSTQEILNFWQLHTLPFPSAIKMKPSCPLDILKYVYMPLPFSLPLSICLALFFPPPTLLSPSPLLLPSPPSPHQHTFSPIPTLLVFHNDSTFPHQLCKLLHSDVQREARHINIAVVVTVNIKPA